MAGEMTDTSSKMILYYYLPPAFLNKKSEGYEYRILRSS